jgi:hypothetical protein
VTSSVTTPPVQPPTPTWKRPGRGTSIAALTSDSQRVGLFGLELRVGDKAFGLQVGELRDLVGGVRAIAHALDALTVRFSLRLNPAAPSTTTGARTVASVT